MKYISGTTIITLLAATAKGVVGALSDYEGKDVFLVGDPPCTASAAPGGVERVSCEFGTDVGAGAGTLYSGMAEGDCETAVHLTTGLLFRNSPVDGTASPATLDDTTITDADRNNGSVTKFYCARADVKAENEIGENMSVLAKLVDVTVTYTYDQEGGFTTEVQTEAWNPETTSATANRAANLDSIDNTCLSLEGENPGSSFKDTYNIQDVLTLCVWTGDEDVDLSLSLDDVTVEVLDADDEVGVVASFPPDPLISLITTSVNGGEVGEVELSFLLIPRIWDFLRGAAGSLEIKGNVELTYYTPVPSRRLSGSNKRVLQEQETAPFTLEVELAAKDMPAVTQSEEDSGSQGLGLGVAAIASAFVAMV